MNHVIRGEKTITKHTKGNVHGYSEYKSSGVEWLGDVPEHWEIKRTRFMLKMNPSKQEINHLDPDTELDFLPMEAVGEDGMLRLDATKSIAEVSTGYTYFSECDVTFAKITPCFENGKGAIMRGLKSGCGFGTTELTVMRPSNKLDMEYLYYISISRDFRKNGEAWMYGAGGQKRVPDDFVKELRFAFPPLPEQQAIAAFLDHETGRIDTLIGKKKMLVELLKEKRTALISRAVTKGLDASVKLKPSGVEWLGEVPEHWEVDRLKWSVQFVQNGVWGDDPTGVDDTVCVRVADFDREKFKVTPQPETFRQIPLDQLINKRIQFGDLLLEKSGGGEKTLVGCVVLYDLPIKAVCSNFVARMPLSKGMDSRFWSYAYASLYAGRMTYPSIKQTTGIQNLDSQAYLCEKIGFPPFPEQQAIAAFLAHETSKIDTLVSKVEIAIEKLKEYRTALISAAVTGKIDVREAV